MNYQDVTPDFLVYNTTAAAGADVSLANQEVSFEVNGVGPFVTLNYNLIQHVTSPSGGFVAPVAATPAQWTITTVPVANTTYSVNILQIIDGVAVERQISYTTPAVPVANDAAKGLAAIINKLLSVGTFELTSAIQAGDVVTVTATASNPTFTVSVGTNVVVNNSVPGVPARGQGADLVGIVGLNGVSPVAGNPYATLTIDYQTDRIGLEGASRFQRKELVLLVNTLDAPNAANFIAAVENILLGTATTAEYLAVIEP
jgi:hypothetical protein